MSVESRLACSALRRLVEDVLWALWRAAAASGGRAYLAGGWRADGNPGESRKGSARSRR